MIEEIFTAISGLWDKIPPRWRDWSKSELLNFAQNKIPEFFKYCRDKISNLWGRVPNSKVKTIIDNTTSTFLALNDKIPPDVKQRLFEQITGSQYNPDPDYKMQDLSEIVQTDDEKKAAAMQMSYLIAVLGEINQKQESMLEKYMNSLKITEELKQNIVEEVQEANKELAKFVQILCQLDREFEQASTKSARAKKEANDIIDLI